MAIQDYSKMFYCPKCATSGSIIFLKFAGKNALIKQKCPKHGVRVFKIPVTEHDKVISEIRDGIYRCPKCGQNSKPHTVKPSGPFTLIKVNCPKHGVKVPFQKIWTPVYNEIVSLKASVPASESGPPNAPEPEPQKFIEPEPEPQQSTSVEKGKFCQDCGTELTRNEIFCSACGTKIE